MESLRTEIADLRGKVAKLSRKFIIFRREASIVPGKIAELPRKVVHLEQE